MSDEMPRTEPPTDPARAAEPAATAPSPHRSRRLHLLAGLHWLALRTLAVVVFVAGVALGYNAFLANQPEPTVAVDPATDGVSAPAVVQEFITALSSNDTAALRAAVPSEPYQLLIAEMARWDFQTMSKVETLSTYVDGPRTATELVMSGTSTAGTPISVNLIVHVDDGQIASFR